MNSHLVLLNKPFRLRKRFRVSSLEQNEQIFKRQHVIDLHLAWHGVRQLDPSRFDDSNYVTEIVAAGNLLGLTATLWNHVVVETVIIYRSYWTSFDTLYQSLARRTTTHSNNWQKWC